jgi:ABC-type uncharacterized transport system substrate-binding protein
MQEMIVKRGINNKFVNGLTPLHFFSPVIFSNLIVISMLFLFLLTLPSNLRASTEDEKILIVYQKYSGFTQQLIDQLHRDLSGSGYKAQKLMLATQPKQFELLRLNKQHLIIAIGSQTTKTLLETEIKTPILSALIPRYISKSLQIAHPKKKNWSSLLINQPIDRQFHLITAIFGKKKNTAILLGPYTKDLGKILNNASVKTSHKINIKHIKNSNQIPELLVNLNQSVDVLLTLPDPVIYNKSTIRGILLSSYRDKLPIIGFSQSYVKAGAIAAVYSTPEQISKQIKQLINLFFINKQFNHKTYYPKDFSVALNKKIARSLGIKLTSNKAIIKQIKKAEVK